MESKSDSEYACIISHEKNQRWKNIYRKVIETIPDFSHCNQIALENDEENVILILNGKDMEERKILLKEIYISEPRISENFLTLASLLRKGINPDNEYFDYFFNHPKKIEGLWE